MAEVTITPAQVLPGAGARFADGLAGVAISAGDWCYQSTTDTILLADADAGTPAAANARGMAVNSAALGQPIRLQTEGIATVGAGAAVVRGTIYVLAGTAGKMQPSADLTTGDRVTVCCIGGTTANTVVISVFASNVVV